MSVKTFDARLGRLTDSARAVALRELRLASYRLWAGFTDAELDEVAAMRKDALPGDPDLTPAQEKALQGYLDLGLVKLAGVAWPLLTPAERAVILAGGGWPVA